MSISWTTNQQFPGQLSLYDSSWQGMDGCHDIFGVHLEKGYSNIYRKSSNNRTSEYTLLRCVEMFQNLVG